LRNLLLTLRDAGLRAHKPRKKSTITALMQESVLIDRLRPVRLNGALAIHLMAGLFHPGRISASVIRRKFPFGADVRVWLNARERSEAIHLPTARCRAMDCFATLAMTNSNRRNGGGRGQVPGLATSVSLDVMNSSSTGMPSFVFSMPRLIAGIISSGLVTRSP
jgi:hypothetical protein